MQFSWRLQNFVYPTLSFCARQVDLQLGQKKLKTHGASKNVGGSRHERYQITPDYVQPVRPKSHTSRNETSSCRTLTRRTDKTRSVPSLNDHGITLSREAKSYQDGLSGMISFQTGIWFVDLLDRIDSVKEEYQKLQTENKLLQEWIGNSIQRNAKAKPRW